MPTGPSATTRPGLGRLPPSLPSGSAQVAKPASLIAVTAGSSLGKAPNWLRVASSQSPWLTCVDSPTGARGHRKCPHCPAFRTEGSSSQCLATFPTLSTTAPVPSTGPVQGLAWAVPVNSHVFLPRPRPTLAGRPGPSPPPAVSCSPGSSGAISTEPCWGPEESTGGTARLARKLERRPQPWLIPSNWEVLAPLSAAPSPAGDVGGPDDSARLRVTPSPCSVELIKPAALTRRRGKQPHQRGAIVGLHSPASQT